MQHDKDPLAFVTDGQLPKEVDVAEESVKAGAADPVALASIKATLQTAEQTSLIQPWWKTAYARDVAKLIAWLPASVQDRMAAEMDSASFKVVEVWGCETTRSPQVCLMSVPELEWKPEYDEELKQMAERSGCSNVQIRHVDRSQDSPYPSQKVGDIWDRPPGEK